MPIYEYKCKACNREFEYQQRMADPDKTDCEACGESALERLISRTAFQLKGSGWYKDLYSSSKPEAKSSDAPAKADSGSSSSDAGSGAATKSDSAGSTTPSTPSSSGSSSTGSGGGSSGTSGGSSGTKAAASAK
jgi:putative FmdB family regulatory protein